jgi:formate hydrogenlyase subunit 4
MTLLVLMTLALGLVQALWVMAMAPLADGVMRRVTARVQSRQGPPLVQGYWDLLKLLGKEDIETGVSPWMQRVAVGLGLASLLAVAGLVPQGIRPPWDTVGDVILLAYLLTLAGVSTLLVGLAAGSTYSLVGSSREMMSLLMLEPLLAAALMLRAVQEESLRLEAVFGAPGLLVAGPLSGGLMLVVLLAALPALVQRAPYDTTEAETELMDGPSSEYSGPKLAILRWSRMMKLVVYSGILVMLYLPPPAGWNVAGAWLWYWTGVAVLILGVTLVAATHARYRIDQALRRFGWMLGGALVALVLATLGF